MYIAEDDLTPIFVGDHVGRRMQDVLIRALAVAASVVLVLCGAALGISHRLAEERARDRELVFTALASDLTPARAVTLIEAADRRAMVVGPGRAIVLAGLSGEPAREVRRWRERVAAATRGADGRHFTTVDHHGDTWWHTAVEGDAGTLVVSTPSSVAMVPWREQALVILVMTGLVLTLMAVFGVLAHLRIGRPIGLLAEAGAQLRVRGRINDDLRRDLELVRSTPYELGQLVDNLDELAVALDWGEQRMGALLTAGTSLGGSLDQTTVLARTLEHLEHLLDVERSAIIRYDQRIERFEVVASRGHDDAYLDDMESRANDPTLPSLRSLREHRPIQVPDTESEVVSDGLRQRAQRHHYRSLLAIPLTEELERPTVLLLHARQPRTYSFDEVELSKSFASIAGAALRNAELFESTDARLRVETSRLEAIMGSVDQGILVENARGRVLFANPIMRSLLPPAVGADAPADSGAFLDAVLSQTGDPEGDRAELERLESGQPYRDVTLCHGSQGVSATYRVRRFEVRDARGFQIGRGQTWRDVSQERELERMKAGLLAAVSHEFRSPLSLIKGYATTLLADDVDWEASDRQEFLQLVSSEADRLADLVKRILDMRRIDAGMVSLQRMPVDLAVVIDQTVQALPLDRSRIMVEPVGSVVVEIDQARIVTVLRNLLENACKYSPDDRLVQVRVEVDGDSRPGMVQVSVRDRGKGVPAVLQDRIFETFVRGDTGLDAAQGGLGLGLAIAKGFVEAHGGRIWVDEPPDGGPGCVFSLTLPLASAPIPEVVR